MRLRISPWLWFRGHRHDFWPAYPPSPVTVTSSLWDSILPSPVQTAPCASQSVVAGSTMVTSALPDACTVISHRMFFPRLQTPCFHHLVPLSP